MKNRYVIEVNNHGKWLRSLNASSISGKDLDTVTFSEEAALREVEFQKSTNGMEYRYVLSAASVAAQEREASQEKFNGLVVQSLELLTNFAAEAFQRLGKLETELQSLDLLTKFAAEASQRLGDLESDALYERDFRENGPQSQEDREQVTRALNTQEETAASLKRIADVLEARLPWGYPNTPPFMETPPFLPNTTYPPNTITFTAVPSGTP